MAERPSGFESRDFRAADWQYDKACTIDDIHLFCPAPDESTSERLRRERLARRICNTECPVTRECLEEGIDIDDIYTVRGGLGQDEIRDLIRPNQSRRNIS